jgi:hypothetical protein
VTLHASNNRFCSRQEEKTDDTHYHVGRGRYNMYWTSDYKKSFGFTCKKKIGVSASLRRTATKLLNLHPLLFRNPTIQITK